LQAAILLSLAKVGSFPSALELDCSLHDCSHARVKTVKESDWLMRERSVCASTAIFVACVLVLCLHEPILSAQEQRLPSSEPPVFEVASVKPCDTSRGSAGNSSPGRLHLWCWPLRRLIQDAYDVFATGKLDPLNPAFPLTPLEGGPGWMNSASYTIDANISSPQTVVMMRGPMMQKLLEDRFNVRVHRETREVPVFFLTVASGGSKLSPTQEGACNKLSELDPTWSPVIPAGSKPWCVVTSPSEQESRMTWDVKGMSMNVFSRLINPGRPVIDKTGLSGTYDVHLEWWLDENPSSPDSGAVTDTNHVSLIQAIRKQLGLELQPGKGPREFLLIDHLERPAEN
jgi:uncharacterized protein (TIGR03435 family)